MYNQDVDPTTRAPDAPAAGRGEAVKQGAQEVAGTVKDQGREVARETRDQIRSVAGDVRYSVAGQARTQNQRLSEGLRRMADQFDEMRPADDSPASQVVRRLGEGGRRAADYLQDRGPEGLLDDIQEFARRKPGMFLLAAAAAGFLVGRLGRTAFAVSQQGGPSGTPPYPDREAEGLYRSRVAEPYPAAPAGEYPTVTTPGAMPGVPTPGVTAPSPVPGMATPGAVPPVTPPTPPYEVPSGGPR